MRIGFLHSVIRPEEKMLINEFRARPEVDLALMDDRELQFNLADLSSDLDVVLNRSVSASRAINAIRLFECMGVRCINSHRSSSTCSDKLLTSAVLQERGLPQPEVRVAFSEGAAVSAMEKMGFPVVLKPAVGSWGRLLSKINDLDAARAILEHKRVLGAYQHAIIYIQKYIEKKGRDIRVIVVGDDCVAASYRTSEHWITNTARGGVSKSCEITDEIRDVALSAAHAVAADMAGVDLFESDGGFLVNEINDTMEFKSCRAATGIDVPGAIVDFVVSKAAEMAVG